MQILPPDARTIRAASFRVISDRFLTSLAQWEQKRTFAVPVILSQSSVHGVLTSTESIKLFLDIVLPLQNARENHWRSLCLDKFYSDLFLKTFTVTGLIFLDAARFLIGCFGGKLI